ncbi:MAG: ExbD/TolR family protein [Rhodospirillaceae bacterium]
MAFGAFNRSSSESPMAEINMIPLVDVMLVLLVIFIVTAPLLTHALKIDLPRASTTPNITKPEHVSLAIDAAGRYFWNGAPTDKAGIAERAAAAARQQPQPEVHIRADKGTTYQTLAEVMATVSKAGLARIGFVSDPRNDDGRQ